MQRRLATCCTCGRERASERERERQRARAREATHHAARSVMGAACALSGYGVWGEGCDVSGFVFRVSGFGVRVSGFGSRVSGFGPWRGMLVGPPPSGCEPPGRPEGLRDLPAPDGPFQVLVLHWESPESGGLWYKSRQLKKNIAAPPAGCTTSLHQGGGGCYRGTRLIRNSHPP